ncbi:MAG: hypothetical protein RL630_2342, partial [Verrucomicrobiota bacterium]
MTTKHLLATACLAAIAIVSIPQLSAQDAAPAASPAAPAPKDKTLLDSFYAGGPLMWPLLLCSIGTAAVGIYCFLQINGKKMMPKSQVEAIGQFMQARDASSAYSLCHSQPNVFANS